MDIPYNLEAEQSALAYMLIHGASPEDCERFFSIFQEDHFYDRKHKAIFRAASALVKQGISAEITHIVAELAETGDMKRMPKMAAYLAETLDHCPQAVSLEYQREILAGLAAKREILAVIQKAEAACQNGETASAICDTLSAKISEISGKAAGHGLPAQFQSLADLQKEELPELSWIIDKIIPEGLTLLAGKPKMGKSVLSLNIGLAVAQGGYALGHQCEPGTVLYLALEDNKRRMQRRSAEMIVAGQWPENFLFSTEFPSMPEGGIQKLEAAIIEHAPRLVIIDTLKSFSGARTAGGGTLYDQDYELITQIHALGKRTGIAIILVHHTRKTEADDIHDTVSGSYGVNGAVDTIAILHRKQIGHCLALKGRDIDHSELLLEQDAARKTWRLVGDAQEMQPTINRQKIMDTIREQNAPLSPKEIADLSDVALPTVKRLLPQIISDGGEVEKVGYGKYVFSGTVQESDTLDTLDTLDTRDTLDTLPPDLEHQGFASVCPEEYQAYHPSENSDTLDTLPPDLEPQGLAADESASVSSVSSDDTPNGRKAADTWGEEPYPLTRSQRLCAGCSGLSPDHLRCLRLGKPLGDAVSGCEKYQSH